VLRPHIQGNRFSFEHSLSSQMADGRWQIAICPLQFA
jgi:hypothetical protein